MIVTPPPQPIPLRSDEDGTLRVGESRVTFETVLARFNQGDSPDDIQAAFPTLKLAEIYAVITYYLTHQEDVEAYLQSQADAAAQVRAQILRERPDVLSMEATLKARLQPHKKS